MKVFYVEGNIGSGKSTFCNWIENNFNDKVDVIYEPVDEWKKMIDKNGNNLLDFFYKDPNRWAYTFQMMAFTSRVNSLEKQTNKKIRFVDRSIYCDCNVFAKNCHETGLFNDIEWKLYKDMYKFVNKRFKYKPTAFIYLKTTPDTCKKRISNRARKEEQNIPIDYLTQISDKHDEWLNDFECYVPVITINENMINYKDEKKMKIIKNLIIKECFN